MRVGGQPPSDLKMCSSLPHSRSTRTAVIICLGLRGWEGFACVASLAAVQAVGGPTPLPVKG
eukprot:scaffold25810_cov38-Phaeocystis_antarctica.AAC.1